jgi:hypothetical protein
MISALSVAGAATARGKAVALCEIMSAKRLLAIDLIYLGGRE